jgi:signal transduction histidine kinase
MYLFVISSFLTAGTSFLLGLFVLLSKLEIRKLWFLTTLCISIWSFSLGMEVSSTSYEIAFLWNRFLNLGAIFMPIFFYNFITLFLKVNKKEKILVFTGYFCALIFSIFNFFTRLFVKGVPPKAGFSYWIEVGPIYYLFFAYFIFYFVRSALLLLQEKKKVSNVEKRQINYLLLAILLGVGGGVTNFFPQIFNTDIYPIGNYLVVSYTIFITYAVLKHHLFDIRVIATELFTFALFIILLIKTLLSNNLNDLLLNGGIFIFVTFFGILLIRSVWKEVKQREKMEQMAKELERAYNVEKEARAKIQELDEAKTQFLMATQHHFRTPLTSMRGYIDLILTGTYGKISPKVKEAVLKLETSTIRLIRIVNELLDVSQFQLGKKVVSLEAGIRIEPILKEVLDELKFTAKSKGIYLKFERPENPLPPAMADVEKLKVALYNIIDNGIKYTNKGGITIRCLVLDNELEITSKDTGIGITPEEKGGLFAGIFERGKEAKKVFTTGRGIGLYISGQIIKAHNGKVWVESEGRGKGSTFHIRLPLS